MSVAYNFTYDVYNQLCQKMSLSKVCMDRTFFYLIISYLFHKVTSEHEVSVIEAFPIFDITAVGDKNLDVYLHTKPEIVSKYFTQRVPHILMLAYKINGNIFVHMYNDDCKI